MLLSSSALVAQDKIITVQTGGTSTYFTSLDTAIFYAQPTSKIYLSGVYFGSIQINKKVNIVGATYNSDSSGGNLKTSISLQLDTFADGSTFKGLELGSSWNRQNIRNKNITFEDCWIKVRTGSFCGDCKVDLESSVIKNCIISGGRFDLKSCLITNSIAVNRIATFSSTVFNCILFQGFNNTFNTTTINNCIFNNNASSQLPSNCIFNNNINMKSSFISSYGNTGSNNSYDAVSLTDFLINPSASEVWTYDYRFITGSTYYKLGTDGTEVGVYGGSSPWNQSGRPDNIPFIRKADVDVQSDESGKLEVDFIIDFNND